jgi:hypothetical protein
MSMLCSACEKSTSVDVFIPRYAGRQSRQWGIHLINPMKHIANEAYCKLIEHSAIIMQHNLLFHSLPSWSDQGSSKI